MMTLCAGEPPRYTGSTGSDQEKQRGKSYLNITSQLQWIDTTNRKKKVTPARLQTIFITPYSRNTAGFLVSKSKIR